jgi:hypothetical protein
MNITGWGLAETLEFLERYDLKKNDFVQEHGYDAASVMITNLNGAQVYIRQTYPVVYSLQLLHDL